MANENPAAPAATENTPATATPPAAAPAAATPPAAPAAAAPAEGATPAAAATPPAKTDDKPNGSEAKTGEPNSVVPEKYDLKRPDGSILKDEHVEQVASFAKAAGLSNEQAQSLLDRESATATATIQAQQDEYKSISGGWLEVAKADPEIGGDKFAESAEYAKRFVEKFATPAMKEALNVSRYGDHPEFLRMCARAGRAISGDKIVLGGGQNVTDEPRAADVLFGTPPKK